jgi:aminobenzoyl-glutamate transport protein
MIAAFTEPAAQIIDPDYTVNPLSNYYLMAASVPLIGLAGTWITEKILVPRLGEYKPPKDIIIEEQPPITSRERKALAWAIFTNIVLFGLVLLTIIPLTDCCAARSTPKPVPAACAPFTTRWFPLCFSSFCLPGWFTGSWLKLLKAIKMLRI